MKSYRRSVRESVRFRAPGMILMAGALFALVPTSSMAQSTGRHPDRRFVDQSISVTHTLRLDGPRSPAPLLLSNAPSATIGREDGPNHFIFGEIAGVGLDREGKVIIVDRKVWDVRLFDAQGRFLQRLGRRGQGPGEFRAPHSLVMTPKGELWVADMQRRLTVFAPSAEGYRLARTIPTAFGARSMCFLGPEIMVNAISPSDPYAIRVLDATAQPVRSFGKLYTSPNAGINWQFTEGLLVCDNVNDLVIFATSAALGEVRAYRRDGLPVWRTVLDGVRTNIITDSDGGYRVQGSPDGAHDLVSLNVVPGVGVLLQYGFRTPEQMAAKEPVTHIQTIVIDPRTGAAALLAVAWPRIAAVSGAQVLAVFEDPAPRLEIRELRRP